MESKLRARAHKNFLVQGNPLENNADSVGGFTGTCGDHVDTYLRIDEGIIEDAKYRTDGGPSAVTSASALTEIVKGKRLEEALRLHVADVIEYLKEGTKSLRTSGLVRISLEFPLARGRPLLCDACMSRTERWCL